jgi:hypothetical protein
VADEERAGRLVQIIKEYYYTASKTDGMKRTMDPSRSFVVIVCMGIPFHLRQQLNFNHDIHIY